MIGLRTLDVGLVILMVVGDWRLRLKQRPRTDAALIWLFAFHLCESASCQTIHPPLSPPASMRPDARRADVVGMLKVFVVEDSAVIQENLIAALEELAPVVVVGTAENERFAVDWLEANPHACDLVLVDIFLKGGSGLGVLRAVAGLHKSTSFVVLTNFATPDMCQKCLELGADRVFDKSNEVDALVRYCARLAGEATGAAEFH